MNLSLHPPTQRGRYNPNIEHLDSLGFGKITEPQMKAFVDLVKARGLLRAPVPPSDGTRGIVIAGGGRYAPHAWANARLLRLRGIQHPIQIWHFPNEFPAYAQKRFSTLDVELVNAFEVRREHWHRSLKGWTIKHYAAMHCPFEEVVFYDADCFASCDPSFVWDHPEYRASAALFFSDIKPCRLTEWAFVLASVRVPDHEQESGTFFWNRHKAWAGIQMTSWLGEHSEIWDQHIYGDKDRPYLGFGTTETPFLQSIEREWLPWGIRQLWKGQEISRHGMAWKRGEATPPDPLIPGLFEEWRTFAP